MRSVGMVRFLSVSIAVYADDDLLAALYGALIFVGCFLDFLLDVAGFDRAQHAAHGIDFRDVFLRGGFDFVGELFDGVGAGDGIDGVRDAGFVRDDLLRAQSEQRGLFGGKRERFVESVGVQRLAAAEHGGEALQGDADDIVFGLLRGERRAGGLRVEAQHDRARILRAETVAHGVRPEAARGAELGDFFEEFVVGVEEEGKLRREFVDGRPASRAAWT